MRSLLVAVSLLPLALNCGHEGPTGDPSRGAPAPSAGVERVADAPSTPATYRVPIEGLPVVGDARALVTIVEFADYQCPYTVRAESTVQQLRATYGADLRVVVAAHPLPMHERARPAALAALAAVEQGKFEAMHAQLFARNGSLDDAGLAAAAQSAGLDRALFDAARIGSAASAELDRAEALARTLGVTGTPTFFVNGRFISGAQPFAIFQAMVEDELARAQALVASGIRREDLYGAIMARSTASVIPSSDPGGGACNGDTECKGGNDAKIGTAIETVRIDGSPVRGAANAPVTIVEFTDFECPFCARAEERVKAIASEYGDRVRVVYKSLPLPMHDHARLAAKGALAAGLQGKFWEYHDALFAHQSALDRAALEGYARRLGLDLARFDRDLDGGGVEAAIAIDEGDAAKLQANGTPTFFVNGRRITGAQPIDVFKAAVDKGLGDAR